VIKAEKKIGKKEKSCNKSIWRVEVITERYPCIEKERKKIIYIYT